MKTFDIPTPNELAQIRRSTHLSADDFGSLLGYKDPGRVVRAMEHGERHGRPYRISGTGVAALTYAKALAAILGASDDPRAMQKALTDAAALIPERMRK